MKMSAWLREYEATGKLPTEGSALLAFWGGFLMRQAMYAEKLPHPGKRLLRHVYFALAIKAAEFIEKQE